jgi:RNA-directed DNA polymerase
VEESVRIEARFTAVKATMTALINLVVPLAHKATAMRTTDTAGESVGPSGAVTPLIGASLRRGDVDSTKRRSFRPTTLGIRTSTMATRTTPTRTTRPAVWPSADWDDANAGPSFEELLVDVVVAYFDCRRTKRNTLAQLRFEQNLEHNLISLCEELANGSYRPGRSICFVVTRPKPREVWAADFRDRIVHHLVYNRIGSRFENAFIADSCACIPGRGTLYGAKRLEAKIRSVTQNWSRPAVYLKLDLANFFVSISKPILRELLARRIPEAWWMALVDTVLFHDPREDFEFRGSTSMIELVPPHKRLTNQPAHLGLPIGNLSSQFFANVLLDVLDQRVKHQLRGRHYIRYVDDFLFLHESTDWLNAVLADVAAFLPARLSVRLNSSKTILQPIDRGVDFVGQVIKPWRRYTRHRTINEAMRRLSKVSDQDFLSVANSYFGLAGQASSSHHDRARIANAVRRRGHTVNKALTQTYRRATRLELQP